MTTVDLARPATDLAHVAPASERAPNGVGAWLEPAAVVAVTVLAAALRLKDLAKSSFWLDEGASINLSSTFATVTQDTHPPLYYSLLHLWMGAFGTSEFSVRMPSVIAGVVSVYLIYKLGRLLAGPVAGLWAALLLAVSVFHIAFSQDARMYAILAAVSLLANYYFVAALKEPRQRYFVLYVLSAVLLTYSHLFGWLIVAVQNGFVVLVFLGRASPDRQRFLARWIVCQLVVALVFLPCLIEMLGHPHLDRIDWIPKPRPDMLLSTLKQFSSASQYLALVLLALSIAGIASLRADSKRSAGRGIVGLLATRVGRVRLFGTERAVFLILWLFLPMALAYGASVFVLPVYETRYLIGASPALYLAASIGLARLRNRYVLVGIAAMLALMSANDLREYFQGTRLVAGVEAEDWRQAATNIDARAQPGDLVVFETIGPDVVFRLYSTRSDVAMVQLGGHPIIPDEQQQLQQWATSRTGVWLVQSRSEDRDDALAGSLLNEFKLTQDEGLSGLRVREFHRADPQS